MPQTRIPLKSYNYRPQGRRSIGRPKKLWREQLLPWRRNGSKGPILGVYDDDDEFVIHLRAISEEAKLIHSVKLLILWAEAKVQIQ